MSSTNGDGSHIALSPAARMFHRFAGLTRVHGHYRPINVESAAGKQEGHANTEHAPVTIELWQGHLDGVYGVGIVPIRDDATCVWGAIDIDGYPNPPDLKQLAKDVTKLELPIIVCRSKSGGAHLYLFTSEPVPATLMRGKLMEWAIALGYSGVEVFPKQVRLAGARDFGNWINMPYYNGSATVRYAVNGEGKPLDLMQFLDVADMLACTKSELEDIGMPSDLTFDGKLHKEAPPCLQCIAGRGGAGEGHRNKMMFNIGVLLRKEHGDTWDQHFDAYNCQPFVDSPLPSKEMQGLVKSVNRKAYEYTCNEAPIASVCSRQICLTRKFGIGQGDDEPGVVFGSLVKVNTQPPTWIWDVDGLRVELTTEQLKDQSRFHSVCMEILNKWPRAMKPQSWATLVRQKLESCEVVEVPPDARPDGQMWALLQEYTTGKTKARSRDELLLDKPWTPKEADIGRYGKDVQLGRTYFRSGNFKTFLIAQKITDVTEKKIWNLLRGKGAQHHQFNINGRMVTVWSIDSFQEQSEPHAVPRLADDDM